MITTRSPESDEMARQRRPDQGGASGRRARAKGADADAAPAETVTAGDHGERDDADDDGEAVPVEPDLVDDVPPPVLDVERDGDGAALDVDDAGESAPRDDLHE